MNSVDRNCCARFIGLRRELCRNCDSALLGEILQEFQKNVMQDMQVADGNRSNGIIEDLKEAASATTSVDSATPPETKVVSSNSNQTQPVTQSATSSFTSWLFSSGEQAQAKEPTKPVNPIEEALTLFRFAYKCAACEGDGSLTQYLRHLLNEANEMRWSIESATSSASKAVGMAPPDRIGGAPPAISSDIKLCVCRPILQQKRAEALYAEQRQLLVSLFAKQPRTSTVECICVATDRFETQYVLGDSICEQRFSQIWGCTRRQTGASDMTSATNFRNQLSTEFKKMAMTNAQSPIFMEDIDHETKLRSQFPTRFVVKFLFGSTKRLPKLLRELRIATSFEHPNIVRALDAFPIDRSRISRAPLPVQEHFKYFAEDDFGVGLVMERMVCGDLWNVLINRSSNPHRMPFRELEVRRIMRDVLVGLDHLHSNKVIHLDMKFSNVFCTTWEPAHPDFLCKVGDFGLSIRTDVDESVIRVKSEPNNNLISSPATSTNDQEKYELRFPKQRTINGPGPAKPLPGNILVDSALSTSPKQAPADEFSENDKKQLEWALCISKRGPNFVDVEKVVGTPRYCAPEVIQAGFLTPAADIWSLGIMLYIMLSGDWPFKGITSYEILQRICQGRIDVKDPSFSKASPESKHLLERMLLLSPTYRISAADALKHPWFSVSEEELVKHSMDYSWAKLKKKQLF